MPDEVRLNDDGTVDVVLDDRKVHLPRPKIKQFRDLSEAMERADARFQELARGDWPDTITQQASDLATAELGARAAKTKLTERAIAYGSQLFLSQVLNGPNNPFPDVWHMILKTLADVDIPVDDLPAWTQNGYGLSELRGHWMAVPLLRGPTSNRPDAEPQPSQETNGS